MKQAFNVKLIPVKTEGAKERKIRILRIIDSAKVSGRIPSIKS